MVVSDSLEIEPTWLARQNKDWLLETPRSSPQPQQPMLDAAINSDLFDKNLFSVYQITYVNKSL